MFVGLVLRKAQPLITRYLVDHGLTPILRGSWSPDLYSRSLHVVGIAVGAMVCAAALGALITRFRLLVMRRAGARMVRELRVRTYTHLQRLSLDYFEAHRTGDTLSRLTGDVGAIEQLITGVSDQLLTDVLNLGVTVAILFVLNVRLALVALIPVPILIVLISGFARRIRPLYRTIRDQFGAVSARLQENVTGIRVIKAFHTEEEEVGRVDESSRELYDIQLRGIRLWTGAFPLIGFVQGMGVILVTGAGAYMLLQPNPQVTLGDLFAFNAYVMQLYAPIGNLFRMYDSVLRAVASGERLLEVLDEQPAVADPAGAIELPRVRGDVRFEDVSFKYRTGEVVLSHVSIEARPGETVALVGRSGAGKTTVINLIPRFYDPTEGRVLVDGHDVRTVSLRSLRGQIAIVLQDPFLFNGSVAENIRYGRRDASDAEVTAAAQAAFAHDFIKRLPEGYETEIGERGVRLSGGQKQRIAIARALLADRRILILDEATSMVDTESENLIQKALARLMEGRTVFVIAHRLSTVQNADRIVTLDAGEVVEVGDHESLLARNGAYARMYEAQFRLALEGQGDGAGFGSAPTGL